MDQKKYNLLEHKLQSLEDLLKKWRDENDEQNRRFERRLAQEIIKYLTSF